MKNLFKLLLLTVCFSFAMASSADAQNQVVRNSTPCDFLVQVQWGDANCDSPPNSIITLTVPAFTQQNIGIPAGAIIVRSRGAYINGTGLACSFHIGISCSGYDLIEDVNCNAPCDDYTARLIPGLGISLN